MSVRRFLLPACALLFGAGTAASMATDLVALGADIPLVITCSLALFSGAVLGVLWLADSFRTSTFRCPQADCDFTVRLQRGDAGQARRWQELAHSHPHIGRG